MDFKPQKFPLAITVTVVLIVMVSLVHFKEKRIMEKQLNNYLNSMGLFEKKEKLISKVCLNQFPVDLCNQIDAKKKYPFAKFIKFKNKLTYKQKKYLKNIILPVHKWKGPVTESIEYQYYIKDRTRFLDFAKKHIKNSIKYKIGDANIKNLIYASLSHKNWNHLLSNLMYIIIFGIFVEVAFGSFYTYFIFMIGGFVGIGLETFFLEFGKGILGASAGATALMGAYFIIYLNHKSVLLVSPFFMFIKKVYVKTFIFVPVLYFFSDIVGFLTRSILKTNVAYAAHLGGFAVGMGIACLIKEKDSIRFPFLSRSEVDLYLSFKKEDSLSKKMSILNSIVNMNPYNHVAGKQLIYLFKSPIINQDYTKYNIKFIKNTFEFYIERNDIEVCANILSCLFGRFDLGELIEGIDLNKIILLGDYLLDKSDLVSAYKTYNLICSTYKDNINSIKLERTMQNISNNLEDNTLISQGA